MRWSDTWNVTTRTVRRAPIRSLLMGSGLILGVLVVSITTASGEGVRREMASMWKSMAGSIDAIFVQAGGPAQRGGQMAHGETVTTTLTIEDALAIGQQVPNVSAVAAALMSPGTPIEANGRSGTAFLLGVTPSWASLRGDPIAAGRDIREADNAAMERVVVLGSDAASEYFPDGNAVGQQVRVAGATFEVVGVHASLVEEESGGGMGSMGGYIHIPLQTALRRVYNQDYVSTLMVQLENTKEEETTAVALSELLRQRHAIQEGEYDDFQLTRPRAAIAQATSINAGIRRMIIWIGVVALVIGGIVVANLMFAATSDRQTEIGTRRALGATKGDVLQQFWVETVLVACTAGLLGVALSYLAVIVVPMVWDTTLYLPWWVAFGAFAATALVGLIAGLFPARRAAAMPPAVALSVDE